MVDKIFGILSELGSMDKYKVITTQDILSRLEGTDISLDEMGRALDYLAEHDYIRLKFRDDDALCYILLVHQVKSEIKDDILTQKLEYKPKFPFLWAIFIFLASLLGSTIANVIFLVVK